MDKDSLDAGDIRNLEDSKDGIPEEARPDSRVLVGAVDGQSSEDHHGDGVGHIALYWLGCFVANDGAGCQAVVAHHRIAFTDNI